MPRHIDDTQQLDSKTRRKLEDQRRMQFRRAIEDRAEAQRLAVETSDFPDLIAAAYLTSAKAGRRSARPTG
ncbi:transcriptional regulator [Pseudomonas sp. ZM23]|uniref:Transcriptional regulator n=1 Tax=Pseudomonas triclosanedens TaxID=2961893 RepID=A0ABY7A0B5_9PSED|nr:transcriptional regulator [Pseudomonas triclosanedens]MCP8462375.1 transcriptional regulator [Pseudomonas triclosanedens]MCP8468013.1 transcriptional regulator [Pseudomonas triclosanedens]MCP8474772.1 transcriptional regulator [Pseudomonas triclosanedens]WAI49569.1 transcriptional regulator [Pseudomonas triclosanedens]